MAGETVGNAAGERVFFGVTPDVRATGGDARAHVVVPHAPASFPVDRAAAPGRVAQGIVRSLRQAVDLERERGTSFVAVSVLFCFGAAVYFLLPFEPVAASIAGLVLLFVVFAILCRDRPLPFVFCCAILALASGVAAGRMQTWRFSTPMLGAEVTTLLTGRVVAVEMRENGRYRYLLDVVDTERPKLRYAPDRVRVTARGLADGVGPGSVVKGVARLVPPSGPVRPNGFDFAFDAFFDGNGAIGFFMTGPEKVSGSALPEARWLWMRDRVERARLAIAKRVRDVIGGPEGEIAAALVAGVRAGIPEAANEVLRHTGLAHILSISGLHMALVASTVLLSLRKMLALFPGFSSRYPVKKIAAAIALAALAIYLLISGAAVAAQRAFVMIAVMLVALLFDRAALTMRNLAIAAVVVVAIAPHEVLGPSFQMSFAATAALIGAYSAWSDRTSMRGRRGPVMRRGIAGTVIRRIFAGLLGIAATSIIAGVATGLYGAWHFQRTAPLGLLANLLAMPVVGILVMPSGLLGMLLLPFGLDAVPFRIMGGSLAVVLHLAEWVSSLSAIDDVGIIPPRAVVVLTFALVILTIAGTWLRWTALPLVIAGSLMIALRQVPDVYISEDGRQVALRMTSGDLAVNRNRPSAFTVDNWVRSAVAARIEKPLRVASLTLDDPERPTRGGAFECEPDGSCLARHDDGALVAFVSSAAAVSRFCRATLVVVDDATAKSLCRSGEAVVVTKRDLARLGSVTASLSGGRLHDLRHAVGYPYRPWHMHRRFSREARGLPPRQRGARSTGAPAAVHAAVSDGVNSGE